MTRDEAIKILKTERYCQEDTPILKQVRKAYDMAIEALQADTLEVVRCKDCQYKYVSGNGTTQYYVCDFMDAQFDDKGYCHHGERNDE